MWDFLSLIITLLPNLGDHNVNILAMVVMVFVVIYILKDIIILSCTVGVISLYAIPKSLWLGFFFLTLQLW
jgi:hypothetical protein